MIWKLIGSVAGSFFKAILGQIAAVLERRRLVQQGRREQHADDLQREAEILARQRDAANAPVLDPAASRDRMRNKKP